MILFNINIFQTVNKRQGVGNRLPATISSLKPDCSSIDKAEKSDQPEDWHPTGYVYQFDAKKSDSEKIIHQKN